MKDEIKHPEHYETGKYQCIDVMTEALGKDYVIGHCVCNAFKYVYRLRHKGNPRLNAQKAIWYLTRFLELTTDQDFEDTKVTK